MRIIINYTLFSKPPQEINADQAEFFLFHNVMPSMVTLGYEIQVATWGKHKICKRPHFHLMVLVETGDAKFYKALGHKLRNVENDSDLVVKRSITTEKDAIYDEDCLGYPWKEIECASAQLLEYCNTHGFVSKELQEEGEVYEFPVSRINKLYQLAREKWLKVVAYKEKQEKEDNKESKLFEYLRVQLYLQGEYEANRVTNADSSRELFELTGKLICVWKKREFLAGRLKSLGYKQLSSQVVSYLYFHGYIETESILALVHF